MPKIPLSDELCARLEALIVPLLPTIPDVIEKLLDRFERPTSEGSTDVRLEEDAGFRRATSPLPAPSLASRKRRLRGAAFEIGDHKIRAVTVTDFYKQALEYLVDKGYSKKIRQVVPMPTSSRRYLIAEEPKHPSGLNFYVPVSYKGFFMESHKGYKTAFAHLKRLTDDLGLKLRYLG